VEEEEEQSSMCMITMAGDRCCMYGDNSRVTAVCCSMCSHSLLGLRMVVEPPIDASSVHLEFKLIHG
jgi:hypothetical protein